MSSDCFLTLLQLLARHGCQVVLLVIRDVAVPHDEDDLQPFRPQRPERLVMRVAPRPLPIVVGPSPVTREQGEEGHLVDDVPQRLVAGEAEMDDPLLAAPFRHGHDAGLRLQMSKRLPPAGGVPLGVPLPPPPRSLADLRDTPTGIEPLRVPLPPCTVLSIRS